MAITSRTTRQLSRQSISPQSVQGFIRGIPETHEIKIGNIQKVGTLSSGRYYFKYINVTNPFRLYTLRFMATNYGAGPPASTTLGAALYKANSPMPLDGVDLTSSGSAIKLSLKLISASKDVRSADSTTSSPPTIADLPTTWSIFYFYDEPQLIPGEDYYIGISTYGGGGTFGFWGEYQPTTLNSDGWYSPSGAVPSNNSFLSEHPALVRGLPTPTMVLHSKRGAKRSGYVL